MTDLVLIHPDDLLRLVRDAVRSELAGATVTPQPEWLTMTQMCDMIGCSPDTVRRRVKCGEIEAKGTGKARLYRVA